MAKTTIIGATAAIVSSIKLEDIAMLEKYKPEGLVLKEVGDDGKAVEVFRIGSGSGNGTIGKYGANFGAATNAEGFAVVTVQIPEGVDDAVGFIADKFGPALMKLNKVEAQIPDALAAVEFEREEILENITLA